MGGHHNITRGVNAQSRVDSSVDGRQREGHVDRVRFGVNSR